MKVLWQHSELERLRVIGWDIAVDPVCDTHLVDHGHEAHQGARA